ncbi:MAG: hypothetical protein QOE70_2101 [Chthoniobacter sp.]|jgi:ribosomal protein S18|nr:hypothetical protein [Chthoniobacter sp.]
MASPEWLEIFRGYDNPALLAELSKLRNNVSVFSSQAVGQKNYTKDLQALKDQLSSATRVCEERGLITTTKPRNQPFFGVTNFSGV